MGALGELLLQSRSQTADSDTLGCKRGRGGGDVIATLGNQIVYKVCDPSQEKEKGGGGGGGVRAAQKVPFWSEDPGGHDSD